MDLQVFFVSLQYPFGCIFEAKFNQPDSKMDILFNLEKQIIWK